MTALVRVQDLEAQDVILANLTHHAEAARGAYAGNTERALRADIATFTGWCRSAGWSAMPATAATVAQFIDAMGMTKAPATTRRMVSSVATFHRAAGVPNPCEELEVRLALKRLHREKGRAQAQAAPLNRPLVDRILAAAGTGLRDLRNKALLALAYDTLARRSELAELQVGDLEHGADGAGTIIIRRSKTDQDGAGMVRYVAVDTMRHVIAWITAAGHGDGALFRAVLKGGRRGDQLDSGDVARVFKQMAKAAGLTADEARRISGHSTRVGAAQDMVKHGIELPAVMQAGGWRTAEMVSRYTARLDARRSGAAKLAVLQDRE
jgi:site-specific recombinase XerD